MLYLEGGHRQYAYMGRGILVQRVVVDLSNCKYGKRRTEEADMRGAQKIPPSAVFGLKSVWHLLGSWDICIQGAMRRAIMKNPLEFARMSFLGIFRDGLAFPKAEALRAICTGLSHFMVRAEYALTRPPA